MFVGLKKESFMNNLLNKSLIIKCCTINYSISFWYPEITLNYQWIFKLVKI